MVTTVTTVTTITTMVTLGISAVVGVVAVITLIAILVTRELATTGNSGLSLRIAKFASIGILPLIMAFATIIIVKITELL